MELYAWIGAGGTIAAGLLWLGIRFYSRSEVGRLQAEAKAEAQKETNERMRVDNETYKRIHEEIMRMPDGDALKQLRSKWTRGPIQ